MKLLSWNIWGGKYLEGIITTLEKESPDIICLQEVKKDNIDQAKIIAGHLNYKFTTCEVFTTDRHAPSFTICNTILSKQKIEKSNCFFLSHVSTYKKNSVTEPRAALVAQIDGLKIICTHLGFSQNLNPTTHQKKQLKNLLQLTTGKNCILAGDFNAPPESEIIKKIEEKMANTNNSNTPTRNALKKNEGKGRIDYIFISRNLNCKNFKITQTNVSDHNFLTAEIEK